MHPSLKELAVKVATAKEKEHKLKFSLNGAWPESLCNSLEPQVKQQQEQAQKLKTSIRIFKNTLKYLSNASYQPASQSIPLPPKEKKKLLSLFLFCSLFLCIYLTQREVKGSTEIMHLLVVD